MIFVSNDLKNPAVPWTKRVLGPESYFSVFRSDFCNHRRLESDSGPSRPYMHFGTLKKGLGIKERIAVPEISRGIVFLIWKALWFGSSCQRLSWFILNILFSIVCLRNFFYDWHMLNKKGVMMLINHDNEVYEIDEKCLKSRKVPKDCEVMEDYRRETQKIEKNNREEASFDKIFTVNS